MPLLTQILIIAELLIGFVFVCPFPRGSAAARLHTRATLYRPSPGL